MQGRLARSADIPAIVALTQEAHKRSRYRKLPFNKGQCTEAVRRYLGLGLPPSIGATAVFVDDKVDAVLGAVCLPLYECLGALLITDVFWFARKGASPKSGVAVLNAFHDWAAKSQGPYVIRQGVVDFIADDPERAGRLLDRRGFRRAGLIFEKEFLK